MPVFLFSRPRVADPGKTGESPVAGTATSNHRGYALSMGKPKKLGNFLAKTIRNAVRRGAALVMRLTGKSAAAGNAPARATHWSAPTPTPASPRAPATADATQDPAAPAALAVPDYAPPPIPRRESISPLASMSSLASSLPDAADAPAPAPTPDVGDAVAVTAAVADLWVRQVQAATVPSATPQETAAASHDGGQAQPQAPAEQAGQADPADQAGLASSRDLGPQDNMREVTNALARTLPQNTGRTAALGRHRDRTIYSRTMAAANAEPCFRQLSPDLLDFLQSMRASPAPIDDSGPGIFLPFDDAAADWYPPEGTAEAANDHIGLGIIGPIDEVVAQWYPAGKREEIVAMWHGLMETDVPGINAFAEHLTKLGVVKLNETTLMRTESFRSYVQAWLTQVAESPELLMQTAALSLEAYGVCADRLLFIFTQMQEPRVYDDVQKGKFDLPGMVGAGRQHFRKAKLGGIADAIVKRQLNSRIDLSAASTGGIANMSVEEIEARQGELLETSEQLEVYIRLLGKKTLLDIDQPFDGMCYLGVDGVGDEEVAAAGERVKELENAEFADWLSNWAPWIEFMEKRYPAEYAEMQSRKNEIAELSMEKLSAEIPAEIERMKESGQLLNDGTFRATMAQNNAEILLGAEKWRRCGVEAITLAMQEMAKKLGHAEIMNPRWPSAA
ncbi:MAG TPA: NEL-type E3 ubiquitin ligase domain-containing protein [Herbaspirillum sp.]